MFSHKVYKNGDDGYDLALNLMKILEKDSSDSSESEGPSCDDSQLSLSSIQDESVAESSTSAATKSTFDFSEMQDSIRKSRNELNDSTTENTSDDGFAEYNRIVQSEIEWCRLGKFTINLHQCHHPPACRLVRSLSEDHIANLRDSMLTSNTLTFPSAKPLVGLVKNCTVNSFKKTSLPDYVIEVIDGNHTLRAQLQCAEQTNNPELLKRDFILYAGLTDQQAQILGVRMNQITVNSLHMSEMDYVQLLRRQLYAMCNLANEDDPPADTPRAFSKMMRTMMNLQKVR